MRYKAFREHDMRSDKFLSLELIGSWQKIEMQYHYTYTGPNVINDIRNTNCTETVVHVRYMLYVGYIHYMHFSHTVCLP